MLSIKVQYADGESITQSCDSFDYTGLNDELTLYTDANSEGPPQETHITLIGFRAYTIVGVQPGADGE